MNKLKLSSIFTLVFASITIPASAFDLTINPPRSLTIDGMSISEGQFTLTDLTGFFVDTGETISAPQDLTSFFEQNPVNAQINGTGLPTSTLASGIPDNIQVLQMTGNFDATNPDKDPVNFDITLYNIMGSDGTGDFTYGLASTSTQDLQYQLTDLGTSQGLSDNTNYALSFALDVPSDFTVIDGRIVPNIQLPPPVQTQPSGCFATSNINAHGGGGGTPPARCTPIPEPASILGLLAVGGLGLGLKRKKQS